MLPTPSTSHVDYSRIYEPAEDSFLLLDTLSSQSETTFLQNRFPPSSPAPLIVEVGTGSGVVLAFVTAHAGPLLDRSDVATLGIDVNPFACSASELTVRNAVEQSRKDGGEPGEFLGCLNSNLATALRPGSVDVLIFNPPYVPSEDLPPLPGVWEIQFLDGPHGRFAHDSHLLSLSTDGGADGMEVTDRLLADLDSVLSARGIAYILLCAQNKPDRIIATIHSWSSNVLHGTTHTNWKAEKVGSSGKKAGWERLCVLRIWREIVP